MVQVEYLNETKTFSPQEISSMVLMKVSPYTPPTEPASNINTQHR
jgi:hypothetical protein